MIAIKDIQVGYDDQIVINELSVQIKKEKITTIIGLNYYLCQGHLSEFSHGP